MKCTKAASVLAISMVAVAAGSSAAAAQPSGMPTSPSMSLNSGVAQLVEAYNTHTKPLNAPLPVVNEAKDAAKTVMNAKDADPMKLVEGAVGGQGASSMLGGLPVG
ncbi:hypothetical protein GCM10010329_81820 [Streptomyces spiroverticillatus]|uniref:Secreted protein n=1 Tax=Streptomyces finlayi TaxID=67296 RepID=A0A919CGD1_9ACTN|nr:hypothetical protein [Streptomyces finlayi]GHA46862.1 hypothetical protein GCM10010329_81820 [Streptomyces spiroverticillatus]GHD18265.1 hypothetical protein GCM10010334_80900 [Streptomyces finlayi]